MQRFCESSVLTAVTVVEELLLNRGALVMKIKPRRSRDISLIIDIAGDVLGASRGIVS